MPDLKQWSGSPRAVACAVELQLHAAVEPDFSRVLADRIVHAIDRAGARGKADGAPTADEVDRATNELHRRGHPVPWEDVYAVLDAAFVRGWSV